MRFVVNCGDEGMSRYPSPSAKANSHFSFAPNEAALGVIRMPTQEG